MTGKLPERTADIMAMIEKLDALGTEIVELRPKAERYTAAVDEQRQLASALDQLIYTFDLDRQAAAEFLRGMYQLMKLRLKQEAETSK